MNIRESDDQSWNIRKSENQSRNIRESEHQIENRPRHEKLWIWQKAHKLRLELHLVCKCLPNDERFRLKDQIQRASNSVADNIAEGNSSYYYNNKIKSFYTARREAGETQNHIRHLEGKRYITVSESNGLINAYEEVVRGINGLIRRVSRKREQSKLKGNDRV